jgi:glycosyltransferase involved in cell wall biosynthesis
LTNHRGRDVNRRIAFIQPAYAQYRRPLFDRFRSYYDTTFYFMMEPASHLQDVGFAGLKYTLGRRLSDPAMKGLSIQYLLRSYFTRPLALVGLLIRGRESVIIPMHSTKPETIFSLIVSRLTRSRCVLWIEEWFKPPQRPFISWLRMLVAGYVLRLVHAVVVCGTAQYRYARSFGVPDERIFMSNCSSIDYSQFPSRNLRDELNLGQKLIVLYLGRIVRFKGLDILLRAYCRIEREREDVALLVCGDGPFRPFCQDLARGLKARCVYFLGAVPSETEKASYYRTADVFVLPSVARADGRGVVESWGLVINEAMSMGKTILASDGVGAVPDLVKEGVNGFVFRNGEVDDLYSGLKKILESEDLRDVMGKNSRRIFEEFNDFNKMFEGFKKAIDYATR